MSQDNRIHGVIAVGVTIVSLGCCVILLSTVNRKPSTQIQARDELTPSVTATSTAAPALNALVKTLDSQLFNVSDYHVSGMCGGAHFYKFQYTDQSDIAAIISANGLSVLKPPAVAGGMNLNWSVWDSGMNRGPCWKIHAADWHVPPTTTIVYSGRVSTGDCYLFVDKPALTAYLEVGYGHP